MRVKSKMCREQQAIQLVIAENDPLQSRRDVATAAAKAWGREALQADKREAGNVDPRDRLDAEITLEFAQEADLERSKNAR
jgi:hypothetical protein